MIAGVYKNHGKSFTVIKEKHHRPQRDFVLADDVHDQHRMPLIAMTRTELSTIGTSPLALPVCLDLLQHALLKLDIVLQDGIGLEEVRGGRDLKSDVWLVVAGRKQ